MNGHDIASEAARHTWRILLTIVGVVAVCAGVIGYLFGRFS